MINDLRSSLHSSGNTISQEFENWEHQVDINNQSDKYRQYLKCADEYRNKMVELENGLPLEDLENAINETYYIDFLMSFANAAVYIIYYYYKYRDVMLIIIQMMR